MGPGLPFGLRFRTQNWLADDQAIPDLVGNTQDGVQVLVVEAKFWAGLTANQPVTYLKRLPAERPGLLLFIAPEDRADNLWDALLGCCRKAQLHEVEERNTAAGRALRFGESWLALTSWRSC